MVPLKAQAGIWPPGSRITRQRRYLDPGDATVLHDAGGPLDPADASGHTKTHTLDDLGPWNPGSTSFVVARGPLTEKVDWQGVMHAEIDTVTRVQRNLGTDSPVLLLT